MKSKNVAICVMVVVSVFFCFGIQETNAATVFDDGLVHDIGPGWNGGDIRVENSPLDEPTTVNILSGAELNNYVEVQMSSIVNVEGGAIYGYLRAYGSGEINFYDGYIGDTLRGEGSSVINMYDGWLNESFRISGGCEALIAGGEISVDVTSDNTSSITITGGEVGEDFRPGAQSVMTFVGRDFAIDGSPVDNGQYFLSYYFTGLLTGILNNGDELNNTFYIYDDASIVLTPEPTTLFLLGLGSLFLRKRK